MNPATLPIRVDKSHLVTIGERLYAESVELVRELVNNAYDADATEVHVWITDEEIRVEDNGLGMAGISRCRCALRIHDVGMGRPSPCHGCAGGLILRRLNGTSLRAFR